MKKKWLTRGLFITVLTCVAVMFGLTGCKKDKPADKEPVSSQVEDDGKRSIANFESLEELYTMSFRNEFGKIELNSDKEYITSGDYSAKLTIAGKKNSKNGYEHVWMHVPVNSKFTDTEELKNAKALCVDVYSLSDEPLQIALNMNFKNNHYGDQTPFAKQMIQKGKNTLRFEILVGVWDWEAKVSQLKSLDFVISGRGADSERPILYMDNFHYEIAEETTASQYEVYQGGLDFDGTGKYVKEDFLWFRGGLTGAVLSQPIVEKGELTTTIQGTPVAFCFSAEDELQSYEPGDSIRVTMRAKFTNENGKFGYLTGTEEWNNISDLGSVDKDGYRTFSFVTTVNAYCQSYMYQQERPDDINYKKWKNIAFSIHYDFDKYMPDEEGNMPTIAIDYVKLEPVDEYAGDWSFNGENGACLRNYMRATGLGNSQPYVRNGILKFSIYKGSSSIRFSAEPLLKKGYKIGDTVTLKMRLKVDDVAHLKMCTAEWGVETFDNFTKMTSMPDDKGYYIVVFDAKINAKDSSFMYDSKAKATDWANIAFTLLPTNQDKNDWKRNIEIDYIEIVQKYSGDWTFNKATGYCLSDFVRISDNRHTQPHVSNGTLKFTIYNGSSSIRFSANELLRKGYKIGETVTLKMRMKVNDTANLKICTEAFGIEKFNKFNDVATTVDAEGYYELIFNSKINQKDSSYMYDSKSLSTDFANIAISLLPSNEDKSAWTRDIEIDYIQVVDEYVGDFTFDGKGDYIFYDDVRTTASRLPKTVKNGNLYFNYIGMTSARFSAEDLLKQGYKIGDKVKVTMRMKINNATNVNICTEALGVEKWNALTSVGTLDGEGYYVLTYTTTINEKDSEFIYDKKMNTTDWANIAFTLHSTKDRDLREIAIDYIKVEPVEPEPPAEEVVPSTSWEFEDANEKLNMHMNSASEASMADGKLSVTSSNGWSAIRFSAANLIAAGYQVGDDIQVTMRIKPANAGNCTFYGAPYGSGWTNGTTSFVVTDMLKDGCAIHATQDAEGYYTFTYATKINAKDSDWLNNANDSDAEWANVGIMFNFGNATTKNVLIDYIRVDEQQEEKPDDDVQVSTNWEFDNVLEQLDMHKNTASTISVENGTLSVTSSNGWSALRFSATKLLSAGYKVGDKICVTMRIKPANAGNCTFYGAPYGSGWTNGTTSFVVTDMLKDSCAIHATQDAEGYYTFSYETKINAKDSDWLNDAKATDAEWANVGIMFNFGNATTKNVLIDYIRVDKPKAFHGWNFDDAMLQLDMHKNAASTTSVADGKLNVTSSNGWSALRFSATSLLSAGYQVGENILVTIRMKPANAGNCTFYGAPYGSGWTNGTTSFVVTDMLKDSCAIRATQDAEGYYTFSYETKINAKDSDWLNDAKATDAEWANVGIMFNFGNATTKNVLIDYIQVEKVPVTYLLQRRTQMLREVNWFAYSSLAK